MKSKRMNWLWILGGWLVINSSFGATPEYLVIGVQVYELQERLDAAVKDGWRLKSVNTWSSECPNQKAECLVVILERNK